MSSARYESPMPRKQRLGRDHKRRPAEPRHYPAERCEHETVTRRTPRPSRPPAYNGEPMAQHEDLKLLGTLTAREQHHEREQAASKHRIKGNLHRTGRRSLCPRPWPTAELPAAATRPSLCTPRAHAPVGFAVMPARCTRPLASSMKNSSYRRLRNTVLTVKRSQAMMLRACARRNAVQLMPVRRGAGSMPASLRTLHTLEGESVRPRR